jgi:hypothetical protein
MANTLTIHSVDSGDSGGDHVLDVHVPDAHARDFHVPVCSPVVFHDPGDFQEAFRVRACCLEAEHQAWLVSPAFQYWVFVVYPVFQACLESGLPVYLPLVCLACLAFLMLVFLVCYRVWLRVFVPDVLTVC